MKSKTLFTILIILILIPLGCKKGSSGGGGSGGSNYKYRTVYVGDSHIYRHEWAGENYGKNGRPTFEMPTYDEMGRPDEIYMLVGVNDLTLGYSVEDVLYNYEELLKNYKPAYINIISIPPLNWELQQNNFTRESFLRLNQNIAAVNGGLKVLAAQYKEEYFDIYSRLSVDGELLIEYTYDGCHLNEDGYEIVHNVLGQ